MGLFGLRTREQRFWDWFSRNAAQIRHFESDQEVILSELGEALSKVNDSLVFEIGPDESPRQLYISADGLVECFPQVEKLVGSVPDIPDWNVIAFRQPGNPDAEIRFGAHTLGASDIWFSARQGDGLTDLVLYVRGMCEEDFEPLAGAVFILLDNLLGEYVVATRIGEIDWDVLPADPTAAALSPFTNLREVFGVAPLSKP